MSELIQNANPVPASGRSIAVFLKRTVAVSAGVVLGMAIVAGVSAWRDRPKRQDARPAGPPPFQGETAPDTRV